MRRSVWANRQFLSAQAMCGTGPGKRRIMTNWDRKLAECTSFTSNGMMPLEETVGQEKKEKRNNRVRMSPPLLHMALLIVHVSRFLGNWVWWLSLELTDLGAKRTSQENLELDLIAVNFTCSKKCFMKCRCPRWPQEQVYLGDVKFPVTTGWDV